MDQEYKFATSRQLSYGLQRMAEVLPVAKRFGQFNFFCDFANSEGRKLFSKYMHYILLAHTNTKTFPRCPKLVPLAGPADLNENITFQLRSFSVEEMTDKDFLIEGHKLPGICVYFEMKAHDVAAQTWK